MKILFLLPPSEGKNSENRIGTEELSFEFKKPLEIAFSVTEKDLKCKGNRFSEGVELNKNIEKSKIIEAIKRYSGVMYNAIDYKNMNTNGRKFFDKNFLILSGMYGIVKPQDLIGNYKLPIDTKGLFDFWGDKIVKKIANIKPDYIVNLLPISYSKLLGLSKCKKHIYKRQILIDCGIKILNINFLKQDGSKITHGVKKIKGEWIKNICENSIINYDNFTGDIKELDKKNIDINITI